jgi:phospholipid transport system substrate-binding protein
MSIRRATLVFGLGLGLAMGLFLAPAMLGAVAAAEPSAAEPAADEPAADEPAAVVREILDSALEIVRGEGTRDEKLVTLRTVARDILDTRAMGRRAMGHALAAQPPAQQEEYLELFDHLIVRAYLSKLLLFREPRFDYGTPRNQGDVVIVGTKIITSKDEYLVDYEMREREGHWSATDVIVEGVSLTKNYHSQFSRLLRDRSFEELLDLIRRKTQRLREEPA